MREPMHPIYTAVPARSVTAYAKRKPIALAHILCAAIVDSENAEDASDQYGVYGTPHSLRDFLEWRGAVGVDLALQISSQWTMQQDEARPAILEIVAWDHRAGVWCACQAAREALRFVPEDEARPRLAIETVERWVVGEATIGEVRAATASASAAAATADAADAANAAEAVAYVSNAVVHAAHYDLVSTAIFDVAEAYAERRENRGARGLSRYRELIRLREVISNACMTFPR